MPLCDQNLNYEIHGTLTLIVSSWQTEDLFEAHCSEEEVSKFFTLRGGGVAEFLCNLYHMQNLAEKINMFKRKMLRLKNFRLLILFKFSASKGWDIIRMDDDRAVSQSYYGTPDGIWPHGRSEGRCEWLTDWGL